MSVTYKVIAPVADVRETPDTEALRGKLESQLLMGETFVAEEDLGDWVRGKCGHDGYPGFVEKKYLSREFAAATHVVTAQRSQIYRDATMKSPVRATVGLGSQLTVVEMGEKFAKLDDGTFIPAQHVAPVSARHDFVDVATRLLETPYVWGGRGGLGNDCSGVVQVSLALAGHSVPRDTEDQEKAIGRDVTAEPRQRGDLVYFPGHVGIMVDGENLLHANAHHMKTVIEPLATVIQRGSAVSSVRRV